MFSFSGVLNQEQWILRWPTGWTAPRAEENQNNNRANPVLFQAAPEARDVQSQGKKEIDKSETAVPGETSPRHSILDQTVADLSQNLIATIKDKFKHEATGCQKAHLSMVSNERQR